jgi:uroporphyrinogen decarboxylase
VVEALFERLGSTYVRIAKRLMEVPRLGAVLLPDDLAYTEGFLVSPDIYRKYVFPWYRQIGEILANNDIPFIFHSDGKLWGVLDDLIDCGVKAIHPIEPQAMDIREVKRKYGDKLCIFGNIDLDYTLTRGTVEEVKEQVKQRIRDLAPGGGYGLSASNSVPDYVKPENFRAMVEAAKQYGKYPIRV